MVLKLRFNLLFLAATIISLVLSLGCSNSDDGKIPITTSSDVARQFYIDGRDLSEKLRQQEALILLEQAVAEDSEFALGYLNLAFVRNSNKEFLEEISKAVALVDEVSKGERLLILGVQAGINTDLMKQRELYELLVKLYPKDERAHNTLANHYFGLQEFEISIGHFNDAISINPTFSQPYNQLGYAYRFLKQYDKAKEAFLKYIELIPDDPNPYDSYAEMLLKKGMFEESIEYYEKAIATNSIFMPSYAGVATNLMLQGQYEKARERLDDMYAQAQNNGNRRGVLFVKAITFVDESKYDLAISEFEKRFEMASAIDDPAGMATDLNFIAEVYLQTDKLDDAQEYFVRSLRIMKESDLSKQIRDNAKRAYLFNTSRLSIKNNSLEKARGLAAKFRNQIEVLQNPGLTRLSHRLSGMIALEDKNYLQAIKELKQANQQNSHNLYRLALAYLNIGDMTNARLFCEEAAHFNQINSLNNAFIRHKALALLATLEGS